MKAREKYESPNKKKNKWNEEIRGREADTKTKSTVSVIFGN